MWLDHHCHVMIGAPFFCEYLKREITIHLCNLAQLLVYLPRWKQNCGVMTYFSMQIYIELCVSVTDVHSEVAKAPMVSTLVNPEPAPWPLPAKTTKKTLAPANIAKKRKKPVKETRCRKVHIPAKPKEAALAHGGAILAGTPPNHQHACPYYLDGSILSIENIKYYVGKGQFLAGKGCTVCGLLLQSLQG
jgi:hypothetical protein